MSFSDILNYNQTEDLWIQGNDVSRGSFAIASVRQTFAGAYEILRSDWSSDVCSSDLTIELEELHDQDTEVS